MGETDDMMLEYRFDVTGALREGENEIAVHIRSTVNAARNMDYPMGVRGPGWEHTDEMICVRKPGHMFGWDIAPRFVSAGLWRSVSICPKRDTYFKEVYMTTLRADRERAQVLLKFRFAAEDPMLEGFAVQVRGTCAESSFCETVRVKFCSDELSFWVPEPKLWWPRGYGPASLYRTQVELLHHGEVQDVWELNLGDPYIRSTDEFLCRVTTENSRCWQTACRSFARVRTGCRWTRSTAGTRSGMNRRFRCSARRTAISCGVGAGTSTKTTRFTIFVMRAASWSGRIFSLACAIYPQTDEFAKIIEREAAAAVVKLRNHPSILLWSGDNEVDAMYYNFGYDLPHVRNNRLSREVLPRVAASHDPFRFFLPSSPYIPLTVSGDLNVPEQHNWGAARLFQRGTFTAIPARISSARSGITAVRRCRLCGSLSRKRTFGPSKMTHGMPTTPSIRCASGTVGTTATS